MRGQTNAVNPPITVENGLSYSYDGVIWKKFGFDGTDIGGCAQVDSNTNIIQVNASGYDIVTDTLYYNDNGVFYIKLDRDCNIYYCVVGGGGGSSGDGRSGQPASWSATGGGGGAGGQVIYNKVATPYSANTVFKFQIGTGGGSGGGYYGEGNPPKQGNSTVLSTINLTTGTETVIQEALGGQGASNLYTREQQNYSGGSTWMSYVLSGSPAGGVGIAEVSTSTLYSKSSQGGTGTTGNNTNSSTNLAGTTWPQNNITYGGGGGGAGGQGSNGSTLYTGMTGGTGGGGAGGKNTGAWDNYWIGIGQPGLKNTGGGAGGGNSSNYSGSVGGSGVCLIKIE